MKPTLEQVKAYMESDLEVALPPSPYEIALTLGAALLSSGRFVDDASAAIETAWGLVIPFYQGRLHYERQGQTLATIAAASPPEGEMSIGEVRAYITGGETGMTGEDDGMATMSVRMQQPASQTLDIAAITAKQQRVHEATQAVLAAERVLNEAKAAYEAQLAIGGDLDKLAALKTDMDDAQAAFDAAAQVQSKAYED